MIGHRSRKTLSPKLLQNRHLTKNLIRSVRCQVPDLQKQPYGDAEQNAIEGYRDDETEMRGRGIPAAKR